MVKLEVNVADMTKIPSYVATFLLKQEGLHEKGVRYGKKTVDDAWYVIEGDKTRISAISALLTSKGVRNRLKEVV
jgi:hypothetical protein